MRADDLFTLSKGFFECDPHRDFAGVRELDGVSDEVDHNLAQPTHIGTKGFRHAVVDVARAVVNGGLGLLELRPMRMSLEEIFLQLTTEDQPAAPAQEAKNGQ